MTKLIMTIGIPGSGKSSLARYLVKKYPQWRLISSDTIRAELFGNESIQGPWLLVWRRIEEQFRTGVQEAPVTIYDATNAARKQRKEAIALARSTGFTYIVGVWLNPPLSLCLARNKRRSRTVPEDIILRMYRQLQDAPPTLADGLDRLHIR